MNNIPYTNTTNDLKDFLDKKETELKSLISKEHKGTGHLIKSIKLLLKYENNKFQLITEGLEYLFYLDDGEFWDKFYKKFEKELILILENSLCGDIEDFLTKD